MARLAALLMLAALASPAGAAPFLAGHWFGQGEPGDKTAMFLAHMLPDGGFRVQFRSCVKGKPRDSFEAGSWVLKGDLETITILTVNGLFDPRTDVYRILWHDDRKQSYRFVPTGFAYSSSRVGEKFQMPDCGLTS